jgi:hypothetical protein
MSAPRSASGGRGAPARRSAQCRDLGRPRGAFPWSGPLFRALRACASRRSRTRQARAVMITILHPGTPLGPGHRAAATPPGPPPARLPPPAHPRPRRLPTSSSSSWSLAAVIAASPTTAARPRPCAAAGMSGSPWAWPTQFHRLTLAAYDRLHCLDLEHLAVDGCITKALRWPGRRAPHGDAAAWSGPLVGSCCLPCSRAGPHLEPVGKGWPSRDARVWSPTAQPHWRSGWTLPPWTAGHCSGTRPDRTRADT